MLVGSLVKYKHYSAKGLVLKRIKGRTFDEVLVLWYNPDWIAYHKIVKAWEAPKHLTVISR